MKSNAKFFSGLGLGLLVSFIFLNVNTLKSEKPSDPTSINSVMADNSETNGIMMNTAEAEALISAYQMYTTSPDAKMVTQGGVIDRRVLKSILGSSSDDLIKYRFYKKDNNIGIMFYPKRTSTQILRNGYSAFCPNMCN